MMEKLNILVITNTYPTTNTPGDAPQIKDQVEAIKAKGNDVEVMYVSHYRGIWSYIAAALKIMGLSFQHRHYDLIHAYYGHCGFLARLQAKYPVVVTFLGSDLLYRRDSRIGKPAARLADGVIVQSEEMKRVSKREDARVIPFGVNLNLFKPYPMQTARRELGLDLDEKLVLFPWDPARVVKRYDLIEEAVRIVNQKREKVRLISVYDKPHEVVAKYMNACNVMVLASFHEGSPMALREAMACNLPIVAVDVGDVRQIIEGVAGCFLCTHDPADIAEKINLVLDRGERTSGALAIRQADASWGADQVLQLYRFILRAGRGGPQ